MSGQQLSTGGFSIKLTARHQRSGREKLEPAQDPRRLLGGDGVAWWQPTLDESGAWVCSAAVVGKDGATVCKPWSVTLTVAERTPC